MTALAMPFDELAFHETILTARVAWAKARRAKYRRRVLTILAATSILSYATHPPPPLPLVGRDVALTPAAPQSYFIEDNTFSVPSTWTSPFTVFYNNTMTSSVSAVAVTLVCYDGRDWDRCISDDSTATTELSTVIVQ